MSILDVSLGSTEGRRGVQVKVQERKKGGLNRAYVGKREAETRCCRGQRSRSGPKDSIERSTIGSQIGPGSVRALTPHRRIL